MSKLIAEHAKAVAGLMIALIGVSGVAGVATIVVQNNNNNLQQSYNSLLVAYGSLLGNYSTTLTKLSSLNSTYNTTLKNFETLQALFSSLNSVYGILTDNYTSLKAEYQNLNQTYESLKSEYSKLQNDYNTLKQNYNALQDSYSSLLSSYNTLEGNYADLQQAYQTLQSAYNTLQNQYNNLLADYNSLQTVYNNLQNQYSLLQQQYDALYSSWVQVTTWIKEEALPVQYFVFAEACRRYYYESMSQSRGWIGYADFTRMVVLHDANKYDYFTDVDNALSNALSYGSNTMLLAWNIFYWVYWQNGWLPNWGGSGLSGDNLTRINTVHQWCVDHISYEYDSAITYLQTSPTDDYPKFPVETAFRTMGDCEDQAMLDAAYLTSCGFVTAMALIHDANNPNFPGGLYHGTLLVHISDTAAFWAKYPTTYLWNLGSIDPYTGYTWCWLDPTWDTPFGSTPSWLPYYYSGISSSQVSTAICTVNGGVDAIGASLPTAVNATTA